MTIVLRSKKGIPLTIEEVDNNFMELLKRIEQLEQASPVYEYLTHIKQQGDELVFMGSLGSELGRAQIPTLKLTPRGIWQINCQYHINDFVTQAGIVYTCLHNHMSQAFDQDSKYWLKMFEPYKNSDDREAKPIIETSHDTHMSAPSRLDATILPILNGSKAVPPVFGGLVIHVHDNTLDVLIGDVNCWRRVRDQSEVKFGA